MLHEWKKKCAAHLDAKKQLVWFHAPSVGEGLQARPVIERLRTTHPDVQIAYSFFSPSAEQFAASLNVDVSGYLPFDSISAAHGMISALAPSVLIFSKLDVWPNLVRVAKERGVKTALLSATMAPGSGRQGAVARAVLSDAYRALDIVGAIDADHAMRLESMGVRHDRLSVSGDTRFDQVWARAQHVDRSSALLRALHSSRPTLVAGSTWPADEAVVLPAWLSVKARIADARLIIAPHEPTVEHLNPILAWAQENNLVAKTLSELTSGLADESAQVHRDRTRSGEGSNGGTPDVVVVDRVGVLGDIYATANVAFVGGAFHRAGLHSVIEPAAFGLPVVFGPSYHMSREAGLMLKHAAAQSVNSREQCASVVLSYLSDDAERVRAGANATAFVMSELGAATRSLALVLGALERR